MTSCSNPQVSVSILLVEDEKETLKLLNFVLAMNFPKVTLYCAENGRTGLELFATHTPDIVITDINLPELSGVQMISKIRKVKPDTKVIVLTADTGKATLENALGNGFELDHYIFKPIVLSSLFAAIEQCCGKTVQQPEIDV